MTATVALPLIAKIPGYRNWEGLGTHEFKVLPRVGDHIVRNEEDGIGYAYEVVGVHHPAEPTDSTGDVYVVRAGTITDTNMRLFKESTEAR